MMRDTRPKRLNEAIRKARAEDRAKKRKVLAESLEKWVELVGELLDRLESGEDTIDSARRGLGDIREALFNQPGEDQTVCSNCGRLPPRGN